MTSITRRERTPSNDSGLWITRHLLRAALGVQVDEHFGCHLIGAYGLSEGAMPAAPTNLRNPGRDVVGFGGGGTAKITLGDHRLYAGLDVTVLSVPSYFESSWSLEDLGRRFETGYEREAVLQTALMVGYGYAITRWLAVHAQAALQNHPTNSEALQSSHSSADVRMGPANVTAGLSVDLSVLPWLAVVPSIQLPITRTPVHYRPIVGLALRGTFRDPSLQ